MSWPIAGQMSAFWFSFGDRSLMLMTQIMCAGWKWGVKLPPMAAKEGSQQCQCKGHPLPFLLQIPDEKNWARALWDVGAELRCSCLRKQTSKSVVCAALIGGGAFQTYCLYISGNQSQVLSLGLRSNMGPLSCMCGWIVLPAVCPLLRSH